MTQTPYIDEEELKRLEEENAAIEAGLGPKYDPANPQTTPQTTFKEPTPQQNQAAGNVQPVQSPKGQALGQLQPVVDAGRNILEGGMATTFGLIDFGMDAVGRIPGAEQIDDTWDAQTKFKNPVFQQLREAASTIVPSIILGMTTGKFAAGGGITKGLAALGINAAGEAAIMGVSDQGTDDNLATMVSKAAPWLPVPQQLVIQDGDSPEVRRQKNQYEAVGTSVVADLLGFAFGARKAVMSWFEPKDDTAKAYKASEAMVNADPATATALSEISTRVDEADAAAQETAALIEIAQRNGVDPAEVDVMVNDLLNQTKASKDLTKQADELTAEYLSTGVSRVTEDPVDSYVTRQQISRELQVDEVGKGRLLDDPEGVSGVDPAITPHLFPEGSTAALSIPPGNVARNAADVAAIKNGTSKGTPAPLLSERAYFDLSKGNTVSRNHVVDLAEATRAAGNFDAVVDGFRYTKEQMSDAAWKIYNDIITGRTVDDVKKLFMDARDVKHLLDGRAIKYVNDVQAEAIAFAMRDLTDKYLGRVVNETSARAMDTAAREVTDIASGYKALPETADYDRVTEMIGDRLAFLMEEYGLNKYIAGWALKNQDRWQKMLRKVPDKQAAIEEITRQFDLKVQEKHAQAQNYRNMISTIAKERPDAAQVLIDAFAASGGDVDTYDKLLKYTAQQVSPMGLLKGVDGGLNAFAQGAFAIRYGNMLSGLSALKAVTGSQLLLNLRGINTALGTGLGMIMGKNTPQDFQRAVHVWSAMNSTNQRALADAWSTYKGLWNNGKWGNDATMNFKDLAREDLVLDYNPTIWDTLEGMEKVWEKNGDWGKLMQYRAARFMYDLGNWRWMKYGTNMMIGNDAYAQTTIAIQHARFQAYEEVMGMGYKGEELQQQLAKAEKLAYDELFDSAGNITDSFVKYASGEIALNLDDGLAQTLSMITSKVPPLKSIFMFPKTGVNAAKLAASYTPLAVLPGSSRYSKVLWAGDDLDLIKEALEEHGIIYDATPNAMAVFKGLEAEYRGRVAFGSLLAGGLLNYAIGGNIRGNGPVNPSDRKKLRDNYNWEPKTINIGGKWVNYSGLEPLDTILTLVGDLAYYATDIGSPMIEDYTTKLGWTFAATFVNKTFMSGLEPLVAILNQDETAIQRLLANEVRSYVPWSGALGVASNAITSSQKDIYNDMIGYVKNRMPGLSSSLPERIDIFTGKPLNDIDNPFLRVVNAFSPVKISEGTEPWRQWLINTGWQGSQLIRLDSTGNHEYTPAEREVLYRYIGEQQIWKQYESLRNNRKYNDQLDRVRAMRVQGRPSSEIEVRQLEVHSVLDQILTDAQKIAEQRLQNDNPAMWNSIQESIRNKNMMKQGRVDDAARAADRRKQEVQALTQMYR
jgi:hypothetical protein